MADPNWRGGDYYGDKSPAKGLVVARMIGHITYLSDEAMREKFGRRLQDIHDYSFTFSADFEVESYLRHQGLSFTDRFDANTYLYITRAIDYFDLTRQHGSWSRRSRTSRRASWSWPSAATGCTRRTSSRRSSAPCARPTSTSATTRSRATTGTTRSCWSARRWRASSRRSWRAAPERTPPVTMDRFDYQLIEDMVPEGATVLDLGCGDGELLGELIEEKHVRGSGVDIDHTAVEACVGRGLSRLSRRPRRGPRRLRRRLVRRRHPELQPAAAAPAADGGARDGARRPAGHRQLPELRPLGRRAGSSSGRAHAGHRGAALPVVRHAEHPPLHHQGLPRPLPREGCASSTRST